MAKKYTLLEVVLEMTKNKDVRFCRFGDEKFIIYRDDFGNLMRNVDGHIGGLQIFNYMQHDFWIKIEQ